MVPAKAETAERLGLHDPDRNDGHELFVTAAPAGPPSEYAVPTCAALNLRLVAEPAADLLGFGKHAPDNLRARLDHDFSFDAVSGHASSLPLICNPWLL